MIHSVYLKRTLTALAMACVVLFSLPAGLDAQQVAPRRGVLLVADEQIADPRFRQAVILIISHDLQHTAGLILNKPSRFTGEQLSIDVLPASRLRVYYGGPVGPDRAHLLLRSSSPPEGTSPILDGVHYLGSRPAAATLGDNRDMRLFLGHAGWSPGQLAAEIARGDWHVVPGAADIIFSDDNSGVWSRLFAAFSAAWI